MRIIGNYAGCYRMQIQTFPFSFKVGRDASDSGCLRHQWGWGRTLSIVEGGHWVCLKCVRILRALFLY